MTAWPSIAKIQQKVLQVVAHSRGVTPSAGFLQYEAGAGARWLAKLSVAPMTATDAFAFRAWLHSLRGRKPFLLAAPKAKAAASVTTAYTDSTEFTDGTGFIDSTDTAAVSAVAFGGSTIVVAGATTDYTVGGCLSIGGQLVRVVSVTDAGSGNVTLEFRPRLRAAVAAGAAVRFDGVYGEFRLSGATPAVPLVLGGRCQAIDVTLEESY
jgi:hypothetical protein